MKTGKRHLVGLAILSLLPATMTVAPQAQAPQKTAGQAYIEYRAALDRARTFDDIRPYMESLPVGTRVDSEKVLANLKATSARVRSPKVVAERHTPGGAIVSVEGVNAANAKTSADVHLIEERGVWKMPFPSTALVRIPRLSLG
jgi:hypothetical protein